MKSAHAVLGLLLLACNQAPARRTTIPPDADDRPRRTATVTGVVRVTAADASVRKGRLVMAWRTAEEDADLQAQHTGLAAAMDQLTRYQVVGDVDLTGSDATAAYSLAVPAGDVVVVALLDVHGAFMAAVMNGTAEGTLTGQSPVLHAVAGKTTSRDVDLSVTQHARPAVERCQGERFELFTVHDPSLAGRVGNPTQRRFCVYLPPGYATQPWRRFPTVFLLPGFMSGEMTRFTGLRADKVADALAAETGREMILVGVDTSTATGSTYFVDSPTSGAWETFFTRRALTALDQHFRTLTHGHARALVGHSTGGFNAMSLALRHPDLFSTVVASSPDALDFGPWMTTADGTHVTPRWLRWMRMEDAVGGAGQFVSYAADWSPDDSARGFAWPANLVTGALDPRIWRQWQAHSPASLLRDATILQAVHEHLDGHIFLMAARGDEVGLFSPTQRFSQQLDALHVAHRFDAVEGGHFLDESRLRTQLAFVAHALDPGPLENPLTR